jgi:hypothetical protein
MGGSPVLIVVVCLIIGRLCLLFSVCPLWHAALLLFMHANLGFFALCVATSGVTCRFDLASFFLFDPLFFFSLPFGSLVCVVQL